LPDIGQTTSTAGTISVGGSTINTIDQSGDHDWFQINLVSGQAITVTLNGVTLQDPFLRILDSNGVELYYNDDSGTGLNSLLSFAANYTGAFFIDVGSFDNQGAGDYQLSVAAFQTPPVFTNDQIADQLARGYWDGSELRFNVSTGGSLTVDITGLTAAGQALARQALQTWSEITGVTFVETSSSAANIYFTDDDPDGGAFTEIRSENGTFVTSMLVNVDQSWLQQPPNGSGSSIGSYTYQAYLHEIGHALGLGHAGNYNETATYPYDALYQNDSWATSVMSYFDQTESTYFNNQGFSRLYVVTPMVADILAVQQLYGLSTTTRAGNTTYGFNSTAGINPIYNAQQYSLSAIAYTIFDAGGTDTLDYSGYSVAQRIDLNPEQFSNIGGKIGNVTIARGTIIENAIGGSSADVIIGNSAANVLTGRAGIDRLTGGSGNDTFQDTRAGLNGDTITDFSAGDRIVFTDATLVGFTFSLTGSTLTYSGGSLQLSGVSGTIAASAAAGGGVQLTLQAIVADVRNDFNGDGRSDVLWRHDNGSFTTWLANASGGFVSNDANSWNGVPTEWRIVGTGDFNGDGRDDVVWRRNDGAFTQWLAQGNGSFTSNDAYAWTVLPNSWQVDGVGDFNADGKDDLIWRRDDGAFTTWLGQANGGFVSNDANSFTMLPTSWLVEATGDFNGDGRDDIAWQRSDGAFTTWLARGNGSFTSNDANSWTVLPTSWHVEGSGDFNGDGRDDLVWRNDDGSFTTWLAQPNGGFVSNDANSWAVLPTSWQVVEIGDYNGDGRDDILWRNSNGAFTNWLAQGNGSFVSNDANAFTSLTTAWHVQGPDTFFA
jgi:serralysin